MWASIDAGFSVGMHFVKCMIWDRKLLLGSVALCQRHVVEAR